MTARGTKDAASPIQNYKSVLTEHYADFSGRARRAEYWWFFLVNLVVAFALLLIGTVFSQGDFLSPAFILYYVYLVAVLVPGLAVSVRRLHDTGKSGWMLLLGFIPLVGSIILLVFMLTDGDPGPNQYGPSPKYVEAVS